MMLILAKFFCDSKNTLNIVASLFYMYKNTKSKQNEIFNNKIQQTTDTCKKKLQKHYAK